MKEEIFIKVFLHGVYVHVEIYRNERIHEIIVVSTQFCSIGNTIKERTWKKAHKWALNQAKLINKYSTEHFINIEKYLNYGKI